jgi:hypothetical protein
MPVNNSITPMSPEAIVDEMIYRSYSYNRQRNSSEQLSLVFRNVTELEQRYQQEVKNRNTNCPSGC